jgi:hypothetical protein
MVLWCPGISFERLDRGETGTTPAREVFAEARRT